MKYYSTNKQASDATLEEAVVRGLAGDKREQQAQAEHKSEQAIFEFQDWVSPLSTF